jgi:hypothetical protein
MSDERRAKYQVTGNRLIELGIPEMREVVRYVRDQEDGPDVLHALRRVLDSELDQEVIDR